ncbi:hypothetical protein [Cohnella soli]|uniref:Uncharacterized protein n=1 Tax=Cohnella soli TaxID=425005 RepID=A0ABW0HU60_9BACL
MNATKNNVIADTIREELSAMGFKGLLLHKLLAYIVDGESLQAFYNFIIMKEEEEGRMTKVLLVHKFSEHMQDRLTFKDFNDFLSEFNNSADESEQEKIIQKLVVRKADNDMLNKVAKLFVCNPLRVEIIYNMIVEYRRMYKPDEIIMLLEEMSHKYAKEKALLKTS